MVRLAFAVACCALAAGTAAQAQTTTVTGHAESYVNNSGVLHGTGVYDTDGSGASNYASTISIVPTPINPVTVSFESGNALTGRAVSAQSYTTVDLSLFSDGNSAVRPTLHSQITPAGMGFYLADTRNCGSDPHSCAQSHGFGLLRDLGAPEGAGRNLAGVNFDFQIVANDRTLYSVHGGMTITVGLDGQISVNSDIEDAANKLTGFTTLRLGNAGTALGYAWDATNVPELVLDALGENGQESVSYHVSVSSYSNGACLDDGFTCLIAYSAFGDPIGRGGGIEADAAQFSFSAFGASFGGLQLENQGPQPLDGATSFINGVNLTDIISVNAPTVNFDGAGGVPEPASWMSMILGFGLQGAALRRRRVLAYT